jgi:hypothetical protein
MGSPEGGDGVARSRYPRPENMPNRRDDGNGNGGSSVSLPPWLTFVFRVGVPSAIAVWFVFRLTTTMEQRLERMEQIQSSVIGQLTTHMQNSEVAIGIARQMCINAAKDETQQRACLLY